jgi:replicative DNA helicase
LYKQNEPIDILTIASELQKKQELEEVGGEFYLTELVERIPRLPMQKIIAVSFWIEPCCAS